MKEKNKKEILFLIVMGLFILLVILGIISNIILIKKLGETKEPEPLIKEYPRVCYMPRDCFDSEKDYLDQFPGKEVPEILYECLVYCYK